jgi:hypothetical protein
LALFSLQFEKNIATYWEGWCFLLVAILALERYFHSQQRHERHAWLGLTVLCAGFSLDELGSIHERSRFLFEYWGLPGASKALYWLGVPVVAILFWTLKQQRQFASKRKFWLTLGGFVLFGSVVVHEHFETRFPWPTWFRGIRFAWEEGSELVGIFLLMCVVLSPAVMAARGMALNSLWPRATTLIRMRPAVVGLTLLSVLPMAVITVVTLPVAENRGIPAAWLPFMLLNVASLAAWTCAHHTSPYQSLFRYAAFLALFFSLDQIIVFQRILNMNLLRGQIELLMLPCMALMCLRIPVLRTLPHVCLFAALMLCSSFMTLNSPLWPGIVIPLQALGVYYVMVSGLIEIVQLNQQQPVVLH